MFSNAVRLEMLRLAKLAVAQSQSKSKPEVIERAIYIASHDPDLIKQAIRNVKHPKEL